MAAAEDIGGGVDAAGIGDGIEVRVGPRLVKIEADIEGRESWGL